MHFLLLALLSSATMALVLKTSEVGEGNRYTVTTVNYLAAALVSGVFWVLEPLDWAGFASLAETGTELSTVFFSESDQLSPTASATWSLAFGLPAGCLLFGGLIFFQIAVKDAGVSLAGAFSKLGVLVPMVLSLLIWKELPSVWQWSGIVLAMSAIVLVSRPKPDRQVARWSLLLLFLVVGLAEFSNKVFQKPALMDHKNLFLFSAFGCAMLVSLIPHLVVRRAVTRRDLMLGVAVGIPNLLSSHFLILALDRFPAVVVFPVFSAGATATIFLAGRFIFGERLSRHEVLAVVLILPALVLMNL